MENKRPLILVSNDDGIMAKGISELIKFLRPLGEIVVMAPDSPRSGSGCALTVTQPVHYQLVKKEAGMPTLVKYNPLKFRKFNRQTQFACGHFPVRTTFSAGYKPDIELFMRLV